MLSKDDYANLADCFSQTAERLNDQMSRSTIQTSSKFVAALGARSMFASYMAVELRKKAQTVK